MPKFVHEKSIWALILTQLNWTVIIIQPCSSLKCLGNKLRESRLSKEGCLLKAIPPQMDVCKTQDQGKVWFNSQQLQNIRQVCLSWIITEQIHVNPSFLDMKHAPVQWFLRIEIKQRGVVLIHTAVVSSLLRATQFLRYPLISRCSTLVWLPQGRVTNETSWYSHLHANAHTFFHRSWSRIWITKCNSSTSEMLKSTELILPHSQKGKTKHVVGIWQSHTFLSKL